MCRWEDGQRVEKRLDTLDRWEVHAADEITVIAGGVDILLRPQPHLLASAKVGVGACLWDCASCLTAYLGMVLGLARSCIQFCMSNLHLLAQHAGVIQKRRHVNRSPGSYPGSHRMAGCIA